MDTLELIELIKTSPKKTKVKCYVKCDYRIIGAKRFSKVRHFLCGATVMIVDEWDKVKLFLEENKPLIEDIELEFAHRNSAIPLMNYLDLDARIEPGSIIRDHVSIGKKAIVMMGATINLGAVIGDETMIDMNVVVGGRAIVGRRCHIGAGAVLAGVIEPASMKPVTIEDDVLIGANAVILEGVTVGEGAVVAAGAIVTKDVAPHTVVAGIPAQFIKKIDDDTMKKTALVPDLR
ncbi:MAG TPA: 2,3,4,5-tetrahydropyridine-2,6-dicarboxylate N-acetyltransferase [Firmicutes bacterium]|nr:2,3,4,5-tetrahydropyridine-2,6-dicarboxylate N-acetyltransferase [Bacillota bacterium]